MEYSEKLQIAKWAYQDVMEVMSKWEEQNKIDICFHWDECISVDDELFHGHQMREKELT